MTLTPNTYNVTDFTKHGPEVRRFETESEARAQAATQTNWMIQARVATFGTDGRVQAASDIWVERHITGQPFYRWDK